MKQMRLDDDRRRALAILAENPDGCTRAIMLARGFPLALLNRLVRTGLATSHLDREERPDKPDRDRAPEDHRAGRRAL